MKIITGAFVFTCNEGRDIGSLSVAVRSNLIVELSHDLDSMKRKYPEADIIDAHGKIMLPTFFNAHFHPEAVVCRSFEPRMPVAQWRSEHLLNVEAALNNQDESFYEKMYHVAFFGALQLGVSGIAYAVKGDEGGARGMYSAVKLAGVDVVAFAESDLQAAFLRRVIDRHVKAGLVVSYQKDLTLFGLSAVVRSNSDMPGWIMAHADEDEEDISLTKANFNLNLIQLLKKSNLLNRMTILVGLNGTPLNSLKLAKTEGVKIVIIPTRLNALNFGSIRNVFDKFAIGSDWDTPGLFRQMKKLVELGVDPYDALASGTRFGAELFNLGSRLGSIETGKVANLIFIDAKKLSARRVENLPRTEAAAALIEDYEDSDVSDVMLDGEFVYSNRNLLLYHDYELLEEEKELIDTVGRIVETSMPVSLPDSSVEKVKPRKTPVVRSDERASELESDSQKAELPKKIPKSFR